MTTPSSPPRGFPAPSEAQAPILLQAAQALLAKGLGEHFGSTDDSDGENSRVYVSSDVLGAFGERDLATRYAATFPTGCLVWLRRIEGGEPYIRTSAWADTPEAIKFVRTWRHLAG
jgi:hypothetical protein